MATPLYDLGIARLADGPKPTSCWPLAARAEETERYARAQCLIREWKRIERRAHLPDVEEGASTTAVRTVMMRSAVMGICLQSLARPRFAPLLNKGNSSLSLHAACCACGCGRASVGCAGGGGASSHAVLPLVLATDSPSTVDGGSFFA